MLDPIKPVLPIVILPFEDRTQKPKVENLPEMRHWQIEEFLRQTGKAENTHVLTGGNFSASSPGVTNPGRR